MQLLYDTVLNGLQFGIFLFLFAAGLTLVVGIMNMINLAHGSLFMVGAYIAAEVYQATGSFVLAAVVALPSSLLLGIWLEFLALQTLYERDHLDQVLATFGVILFFNQLVQRLFGTQSQEFRLPETINAPTSIDPNWIIGLGGVVVVIIGYTLLRSAGIFGGPSAPSPGLRQFVAARLTLERFVLAGLILLVAVGAYAFGVVDTIGFVVLLLISALTLIANAGLWGTVIGLCGVALVVVLLVNLFSGPEGQPESFSYPSYRLIAIVVGLLVALGLFLLITRTRMGMLIRAGASNRPMVSALGINIRLLYTLVFGLGAALAGFAGIMIGPIESVEAGMGESKLIIAFVVIVIGGIGSVRGAFVASLVVGMVEMAGRTYMKDEVVWPIISRFYSEENMQLARDFAETAGPALASMIIYILMAFVLFFRPQGLFPARTG